jgi:outer membrane protein OmpA-like peptidoglycan-associated protein
MQRNAVLVSAGYAGKLPDGDPADGAMYYGIAFDRGSAQIKPQAQPELARLVSVLTAAPEMEVLIVGSADDGRGGVKRQQSLCEQRVLAVADVLVASGVSVERLTPMVMPEPGASPPARANTT